MKRGLSGKFYFKLSKKNVIFLALAAVFFGIVLVHAAPILDQLHLNIQTTDGSGNVVTGTYNFVFNISTTQDCSNVVYSKSATLTTDSRGIISYYLNNTGLNYENQYYLCYYRNGVLIDSSSISRTPYSFTAKNVSLSGVLIDSNLNMGAHNVSATYFFGSGRFLTDINTSSLNLSQINYWNKSGSNIYYNGGNVGIGTTNPTRQLQLQQNGKNYFINPQSSFIAVGSPDTDLRFYANNSAYMTLTSAGNVGIGTTSPGAKLDVKATSAAYPPSSGTTQTGGFSVGYSGGNGITTIGNNGGVGWIQATSAIDLSQKFNLLLNPNGGNVGIGTTNPQATLNLGGSASLRLTRTGAVAGDYALLPGASGISNQIGLYNYNTSSYIFSTNSNNYIGVGTVSPKTKLDVDGNGGMPSTTYATTAANSVFAVSSTTGIGTNTHLFAGVGSGNAVWLQSQNANNASQQLLLNPIGGNVGIGTTSPGYPLDVKGNVNAYNYLVNGTPISAGSLGALTGSGAANYIPKFNGTKSLTNSVIYQNGSNVGIGTTSPSTALDVNGNIHYGTNSFISSGIGGNKLYLQETTGNATYINDGNNRFVVSAGAFDLRNGATTKFYVNTTTGNVGIGTTTPGAKIDLYNPGGQSVLRLSGYNAAAYNPMGSIDFFENHYYNLTIAEVQGGRSSGAANNGYLNFSVANAGSLKNALFINYNGNVGIGTTSPTLGKLQIYGGNAALQSSSSGNSATDYLAFYDSGSTRHGYVGDGSSGNGDIYLMADTGNNLQLGANGTTKEYIGANGYVGIGTTSPSYKLQVTGSSAGVGDGNQIFSLSQTSGKAQLSIGVLNGSYSWIQSYGSGEGYYPISLNPNGGNVGIGTTTPQNKLNVIGDTNITGNLYVAGKQIGAGANISGSGTANYIPKFTGTGTIGNSAIYQSGGNIGIGTTSPTNPLTVQSSGNNQLRIQYNSSIYTGISTDSNGYFYITPASGRMYLNGPGVNNNLYIYDYTKSNSYSSLNAHILSLADNSAITKVSLSATGNSYFNGGNVGIGTTNPTDKLYVYGGNETIENPSAPATLHLRAGTTDFTMSTTSAGNTVLQGGAGDNSGVVIDASGQTNQLVVANNGNVGIGVSNPSAKLQVSGDVIIGI